MALYEQLAQEFSRQIERGVLRPGERLPSVRALGVSRGLSQGTIMQAYYLLEDRGLVSTRPRSGYYVNARARAPLPPPMLPDESPQPLDVTIGQLVWDIMDGIRQRDAVPLGSAFASPQLYPLTKLGQTLGISARRLRPETLMADLPPGNAELRRHIARRYLEIGIEVDAESIVITNGASEALLVSLYATTRPGDIVAIESPAHYIPLHTIENSGRRALCIPTCCEEGMNLAALERALASQPVRAVWAMPTFQNPTGALMPARRKRELVELLARHDVPLIENDVYADLYYGEERPAPAKFWDRDGRVLHCGSFSKTLAPGYRVGWVAPGRYDTLARRHKFLLSVGTNVPSQLALADFVHHGGFELHLRRLRATLRQQRDHMLRAITRHFPAGTRVSRPQGGYFLWLQLPPGAPDTVGLMHEALRHGVTLAPGALFTPLAQFGSHLRLNYGQPWSAEIERAVATLGRLAGGADPANAGAANDDALLAVPTDLECPEAQ